MNIPPSFDQQRQNLGNDIIVIGGSAGALQVLSQLVQSLPQNLPAAIFVVLHFPPDAKSFLPRLLNRSSALPAAHAQDGEVIQHGRIYVTPPGKHLVVERGYIRLSNGPQENSRRPAIDVLFRTAAQAYGPRVAGVVLSGTLADGSAGLLVIKKLCGVAIVQNPDEAQFDGMPRSALKYVEADYILPVAEIAPVLVNLAYKPLQEVDSTSNEMEMPPNLAQASISAVSSSENPRMHSGFRCPECGGVLWELRSGQLLQFQCRVGHLLAAENLLEEQSKELEKLLWNTLSTLEEQADLAWQLVATYEAGEHDLTTRFELKAQESQRRATLIRQMLLNRGEDTTTADLSD